VQRELPAGRAEIAPSAGEHSENLLSSVSQVRLIQ
jgi:hypothetical protein